MRSVEWTIGYLPLPANEDIVILQIRDKLCL